MGRSPVPGDLSLAELRRLIRERGATLGRTFERRLAADPRAGARSLASQLAARRAARRRARERDRRLLAFERAHWLAGRERVAGVDEVGIGPLAGPVVAAAVIFEPDRVVPGLDDSKLLTAEEREQLDTAIRSVAVSLSIGIASVEEIDRLNVHQAGLLAMRRAVDGIAPPPDAVLVDARTIPELPLLQEAHVKGDRKSASIAAASIVAKVHRDSLMDDLARRHPHHGFESHRGYGTPDHLEALRRHGPCPEHRRSWPAVAEITGDGSEAFHRLRDELRALRESADLDAWRSRVHASSSELRPTEVRRLNVLAKRRESKLAAEDAGDVQLALL